MNKKSTTPCIIVTLCKSPNYGAYLQAFALKEILSEYGYKVRFLDIYDIENNIKRYKFFFRGLRKNFMSIFFNIKKIFSFRSAEKKLKMVRRGNISSFKVAFIGSDEIWSVTNGTFNSVPEFFGLNLPGLLTFSYAPSVGNSEVKDMLRHPDYIAGINSFDLISVRDRESLNIVKNSTSNDVTVVLDPTFLHDFSPHEVDFHIEKSYILIYTYGFETGITEEIKKFALDNNLILVSAGFYHSWVDINEPCSPFEFLSLIKNAKYVITDTFHGSIFSIKYKKNFICYGRHKQKVKHLLKSLDLSGCLVDKGYLSAGHTPRTDYTNIEKTLEPLLTQSRNFLIKCNSLMNNNNE
ncbi:polysaccharide pyruvyl transferase family protein [Amphritea sp. 2_MG-2023]|uniref:polysaccharide pyruvyl transferase family protein n=1 Tax=Amphritea TaxID=515417 RepID=UPI001C06C02F|nr:MULTISPECIES: polysaccharide pyruvyl transferase family protein [Amphritea]MBU2964974.1 polysaccharide pyruvyl transferase family protein [Amphritea atlantica]MDO6419649.1 polysaccharide pyruvyl transferase family protein [Amphritea sp. 2_MG-2023]